MYTLTWKPLTHNNPFTATAGEGYLLMPQNDRAVINLPMEPSPGDVIGFIDSGGSFSNQPLIINPNGLRINNTQSDSYTFSDPHSAFVLVYTGTVYGWKLIAYTSDFIPEGVESMKMGSLAGLSMYFCQFIPCEEPSNPSEGMIYWDSTLHTLRLRTLAGWFNLSA